MPQKPKRTKKPSASSGSSNKLIGHLAAEDAAAKFAVSLRKAVQESGLPDAVLHQIVVAEAYSIATRSSAYSDLIDTGLSSLSENLSQDPFMYRKQPDGSWIRCRLQPDGTYAQCVPV